MKKTFKELQRRVHLLDELLKDPQFGLASWSIAYGENMKWISEYWKEN